MSKKVETPESASKLVNELTVQDARHLMRNQGGELTPRELAIQIVMVVVVAAMTARAIWVGNATVWHLALPLFAQLLALLIAIPVSQMVLRVGGLGKEVFQSFRSLAIIAVGLAITVTVRSRMQNHPWGEQLDLDARLVWNWIVDHEMHWPILFAAISMFLGMPGRIRNFQKYGPPFMSINLGCAVQVVVLFLGLFLLPFVVTNTIRLPWFLWGALQIGEGLALYVHWDIQKRLRKLDQSSSGQSN